MPYNTPSRPAPKRAMFDEAMLHTPVAAGVVFGAFGWHALGLDLPFTALVTAVHLSFSYRLTQVIRRSIEIRRANGGQGSAMSRTVAFLGAAICLGDAFIVHQGLDWMLGQSGMIAPALAVWAASICLSVYNTAAGWSFGAPLAGTAESAEATTQLRTRPARTEARPDFRAILGAVDAEAATA